jgi:hypothetical protein
LCRLCCVDFFRVCGEEAVLTQAEVGLLGLEVQARLGGARWAGAQNASRGKR